MKWFERASTLVLGTCCFCITTSMLAIYCLKIAAYQPGHLYVAKGIFCGEQKQETAEFIAQGFNHKNPWRGNFYFHIEHGRERRTRNPYRTIKERCWASGYAYVSPLKWIITTPLQKTAIPLYIGYPRPWGNIWLKTWFVGSIKKN